MSRVGDQEAPKWVAYNYRDELVRAMHQIDELLPVVEAACEFVDLSRESHHVPVKGETKIRAMAALYSAVMEYQESQQ